VLPYKARLYGTGYHMLFLSPKKELTKMDMTIRPAYSGHALLMFGLITWVLFGIAQGGGAGFIMVLLFDGFNGLLLLFSVKGRKYIFKDGLLRIKLWNGPSKSVKLSSVERVQVKPRSFGAGDVVLFTASGKIKIQKINKPQELADAIENEYLAAS